MSRLTLLLIAVLAFCSAARADHLPLPPRTAPTVPMAPGVHAPGRIKEFETLYEAAVYAEAMAYSWSHYYEAGGVIVQLEDGKFAISRLFTQWNGKSVDLETAYDPDNFPRGSKIVGDYHQHPCNTNNFIPGEFSGADLRSYRISGVEGFVLDMCTGKVHAFKPGVDPRPQDDEDPNAAGRIIGKIPVDGKVTDTDVSVIDVDGDK